MAQVLSNREQLSWIVELFRLGAHLIQNDLTQVRTQIFEHTVRGFGASSGTLALINEDKTSLVIIAGIHLPEHVIGKIVPFGKGVMGWVAQQGEPVLLNGDISKDPRFARLAESREGEQRRPSSAICWPLRIEGQVVGAMSLNRSTVEPPFTEQDIAEGAPIISLMTLVIENTRLQVHRQQQIDELGRLNTELKNINRRFEEAQNQLLQSEKMASIGQLAAGVAHEINNPIGFVNSNLTVLQTYIHNLMRVMESYAQTESLLPVESEAYTHLCQVKQEIDVNFLWKDINDLLTESQEGVMRVRKIVQDLKEFSHVDHTEWQKTDLHRGLDSTLNIVRNEIRYKAEIVKQYGELPQVECLSSQINQVFMNLLVNAAQAIEERGVITLRTGTTGDDVWVEIEDTGKGIAPEHVGRIFEPFFTTKPVGKGTGLGLSLSWGIVQRHGGHLEVRSKVNAGTCFRLTLPVHAQNHLQKDAAATGANT